MKKISINFCPYSDFKVKKFSQILEKYFPFVFLGSIALVLVNILLAVLITLSHLPLNNLNQEWIRVKPQSEAISVLKTEVEALILQKQEYLDLISKEMEISQFFSNIFNVLPKNIWFNNITLKDRRVEITGYVVEWKEDMSSSITRFITNLQAQEYFKKVFKDINPKGRRTIDLYGRKIMRFEVECKGLN